MGEPVFSPAAQIYPYLFQQQQKNNNRKPIIRLAN